jgi:hypothetical protein
MSAIRPLVMEHLFRCAICQRLIEVVLGLHESPVSALEGMGAHLDVHDRTGLIVVQGCADCLRYTTRTSTIEAENGGL